MGKHDWETTEVGNYYTEYTCTKCGEAHIAQDDDSSTWKSPMHGCKADDSMKLLPCPFCAKENAAVIEDYSNSFIVECQFCRATSRRMYSPDAAAKQWNKRGGHEQEEETTSIKSD